MFKNMWQMATGAFLHDIEHSILWNAHFKEKCAYIIFSFKRMSLNIIWIYVLYISWAFFFFNMLLYKDIKACLERSGPSWGTLISKGIIYEILKISWVLSMAFSHSFICSFIYSFSQSFINKKMRTWCSPRSWGFKVIKIKYDFFFYNVGRKVKHKYADTSMSKIIFRHWLISGGVGEYVRFGEWEGISEEVTSWLIMSPFMASLPWSLLWTFLVPICPDSGLVRWKTCERKYQQTWHKQRLLKAFYTEVMKHICLLLQGRVCRHTFPYSSSKYN